MRMSSGSRRRVERMLLAALLLVPVLAVPSVALQKNSPLSLRVGKAVFWQGSDVDSSGVPLAEMCGLPEMTCYDYGLTLIETGRRLRVAIDHPDQADAIEVDLLDPTGRSVRTTRDHLRNDPGGVVQNLSWYSDELFVANPVAGRWTVRVYPQKASATTFRLRAKLEGPQPSGPAIAVPLLPDLAIAPPFQFTFFNGNPIDPQESCHPAEREAHQVSRCLRYSSGVINVGNGPFELHWDPVAGFTEPTPARQRVYYTDGSYRDREQPAIQSQWHASHSHYHAHILEIQLYRVDEAGAMNPEPVVATKPSQCLGDYVIAEWNRFAQDPPRETAEAIANCSVGSAEMGLARGWGDIYPWFVDDQFIDFDDQGNGEYVLQTRVSRASLVEETTTTNNVSYAHIIIDDENRVCVVERGYGFGPFDPAKALAEDTRPVAPC